MRASVLPIAAATTAGSGPAEAERGPSPDEVAAARRALRALLVEAPAANQYLLHRLERAEAGDVPAELVERWVGVHDGAALVTAALVRRSAPGEPATMCCPAGAAEGGHPLGARIALEGGALIMVGPRAVTDACWWGMGRPPFRVAFDQRLWVAGAPSAGPTLPVGPAMRADLDALVEMELGMLAEDLGISPDRVDLEVLEVRVLQRIEAGKVVVSRPPKGPPVFTIDVARCGPSGAQLGGTYVSPAWRGHGICARAVRSLLGLLHAEGRLTTLHVNEANEAAWRSYAKAGFVEDEPFRLFSV
jgi:GNAT superfamily N-acetyltransferase